YWRPYIDTVWQRHALPGGTDIQPCPGTNAVFVVDGCYVVKFCSSFAGTLENFFGERDTLRLLARHGSGVPAPAIVADGQLASEGWPWPYLVTRFVPGIAFDEIRSETRVDDRLAQAAFLGRTLRYLHDLPVDGSACLVRSWDMFLAFLMRQRALCL